MSEVMANCGISGNDSMYESTTIASSGSLIYAVPDYLIQTILQHLGATDLCHVASCSRWLRDATNQDSFWLPLCQSRGWERYGTTTDLAKIASYGPPEQAAGTSGARDDIVTFQNDRIVTDDNTAGLTSTCRWKGVYMRAYHLDRNWATNRSHFKSCYLDREAPPSLNIKGRGLVDGDLLAVFDNCETIRVFDIRKKTLQCVFPSVQPAYDWSAAISKFRDGVIVVPLKSGVACAFDARAGKLLQKIDGNWRDKNVLLFFDGELVITGVLPGFPHEESEVYRDIYVWCVKDGRLHRILRVDPVDGVNMVYDMDYRDKMVAANYTDGYGRVWDARSGECLHKLKCPGGNVKLGDKVIVGFSQNVDSFSIKFWSQDSGECQNVIHVPLLHNYKPNQKCWGVEVVGNMILLELAGIDCDPIRSVQAYNLRGELVSETIVPYLGGFGRGRKRIYSVSKMPIERSQETWTEAALNVTPNGLVRLFDVDPLARFIWIDDIRMITYDVKERRLLFHHFW